MPTNFLVREGFYLLVDNVKNVKDKLRNDLLDQNNLSSEVSSEEQLMSIHCGMWMHIMKLRNTNL